MNKHCLNCAHYHPLDKSQEIGLCFENNELPPVLRYRFRFETWQYWEQNVCGAIAPILNVNLHRATAYNKELERQQAAAVHQAYYKVVAAERKARLNMMVG